MKQPRNPHLHEADDDHGADDDHPDDYRPTRTELAEHSARAIKAHRIRCRYCGANPGHPCINKNTGGPLSNFHAHPIRITDAETATPIQPDDDEVPF